MLYYIERAWRKGNPLDGYIEEDDEEEMLRELWSSEIVVEPK